MAESTREKPSLPESPTMTDYQNFVHGMEAYHDWLDVDLIHNCFLMGEEVGELFKAIRRYEKYFAKPAAGDCREEVAEEIVDVFNYLCALANRLDIDIDAAFRKKNLRNLERSWD